MRQEGSASHIPIRLAPRPGFPYAPARPHPVRSAPVSVARIEITYAQAKQRFARAHAAALRAEPLCKALFDRWKAKLLLAGHGEDEATRATMMWRLATVFEILAERKAWPRGINGG